MKFNILILLFIITTFLQAEIVIVTNKNSDINSLSKESIKYLYLAKVNTINDIRIKALLSRNKTLHERFINNIINKARVLLYLSVYFSLKNSSVLGYADTPGAVRSKKTPLSSHVRGSLGPSHARQRDENLFTIFCIMRLIRDSLQDIFRSSSFVPWTSARTFRLGPWPQICIIG